MRNSILLIQKDLLLQLRLFRRNSMLFLVPILLFLAFWGYYQVSDMELNFISPIRVGIVVEDDSEYSRLLVSDFTGKQELSQFFAMQVAEKKIIETRYQAGELDAYVRIPANFAQSLLTFSDNPIIVKLHTQDPVKTMILKNAFSAYNNYIAIVENEVEDFYHRFYVEQKNPYDTYIQYNYGLSIALIRSVLNRDRMYRYQAVVDIPRVYSDSYYFGALIILFILFMAWIACFDLIQEFKAKITSRLLITETSAVAYLFSKLVGNSLMILGFSYGWALLYHWGSGRPFFFAGVKTNLLLWVFSGSCVVVGQFMALFIRNERHISLLAGFFVFANAIFGGLLIPIHYMPIGLRKVARFLPNNYVQRAFLFEYVDLEYEAYWLLVGSLLGISLLLFGLQLLIWKSRSSISSDYAQGGRE